ncbi:MAG: D-alanyl-D-alanine carboxypeptidase [Acidimicrobiales bacterium]|nr:D-alanyl-D-alanine carboxypeptidase [Acidimicrobiales bacterium]
MRRLFLPALVLAVVIAASILAGRANNAADPGNGSGAATEPALNTPLFSARRAPEWLRQPTTDGLLERGVSNALSSLAADSVHCLSVHRDGEPIAEINSTDALIPGDLLRLVTVAALDTISPNGGGFTTEIVRDADAAVVDGVLDGDLYLIGGADPVLSTAAFVDRFDDDRASTSVAELAVAAVEALGRDGITAVDGAIVGVDQKYDSDRASNTLSTGENVWTAAEIASNTVGRTDGLLLDNGFESFDPETPDPGARVRTSDPEAHAADALTAWIEFGGIDVTGSARSGGAPDIAQRAAVASIESPPLVDIARRALVDATTAEMLYRELAVRAGWPGDLPLGAAINVSGALVEAGLIPEDEVGNFPTWDGSGLSLRSASQCRALADILDGDAGPLSTGALTGVVSDGISACVPSTIASLDVMASARPEVTAVAGRATASNGDELTFSLLVNWSPGEDGSLAERTVCDDVVAALLDAIGEHPGGPDLAEIAPLPVTDEE